MRRQITVAGVPVTPTVSRKVCMLVMRMMPATAVPRMQAGRSRTTYAAMGAAMTPPIKRALCTTSVFGSTIGSVAPTWPSLICWDGELTIHTKRLRNSANFA
jgi:hypothetical protein